MLHCTSRNSLRECKFRCPKCAVANFLSLQAKRYTETREIEADYILKTITTMENNTKIKNIVASFYARTECFVIAFSVLKKNFHVFFNALVDS